MKSIGATGLTSSSNFELNSSATSTQTTITADLFSTQHNHNKANYISHYRNPPIAPRFLASSQQQQQTSTNNQGCNLSNLKIHQNLDKQQQQQQPQKSTPTNATSISVSTVPAVTNILSTNQQSSVNITSGNSLQSFIAARGLNNSNSFNQQTQNNTNPGLNLLNQIQNQQQQQQQQIPCSSITNSATTALIANLAAAATTQTFSQSLPQCTLNNTLFVGNLHASLQEIDLIQVFRPFGRIVECCKKWLHFGFVKFSTEEEACRAYVTLNGFRLKGRPMRLEFQNRTKKARIKAILAQAALQAANKLPNDNETILTPSGSALNMLLKFNSQNCVGKACNTVDISNKENQASYFDYNSGKPWMNDISIGINFDNIISSAYSPVPDDNTSSSSTSSVISHSSDSGFRSLSYIEEIKKLKTSKIQSWSNKVDVDNNSSAAAASDDEDDDFDSKSCVSTSDTSDDASIINDDLDHEGTSTIATTIDTTTQVSSSSSSLASPPITLIDNATATTSAATQIQEFNNVNYYKMHSSHTATKYTQQLIKDVESFMKKPIDFGIYSCMNKTNSFFVEPEDVLKPLNQDDYNEYQLFPMMEARFVDSYPEFF